MMLRVGEARVPGPDGPWSLGVANPSGLQGKYHVLGNTSCDVMAVSETHLTSAGRKHLQHRLGAMKSKYRTVLTGAPMAPRSAASEAGQWAGVGFVSAVPCRTVATAWPLDLYETGRLQFAAFHTQSSWTFGAVVYGYPEGKTHPMAHQRTEAILDFAITRLAMSPGPRFLAGDFNFEPDVLEAVQTLRAQGWQEVQDLHLAQTGAAVQMTCKGVTRKDHLWLSPELVLAFRGLTVCHETFADHAVLRAEFQGGTAHLERFVWPCPKEVPWQKVQPLSAPMSFASPVDPTTQYQQLWHVRESQAQLDLQHDWLPSMKGRGHQTAPHKRCNRQAPMRQGRSHDVQPAFFGYSAMHAKQFKQVRRLQNYCRWAQGRPTHGNTDNLHGIGLWNSILRAPGFSGSFSEWWPSRQYVSPMDPVVMPQFCPGFDVACQVYDAVLAEVRLLEQRLTQAKTSHRRQQHEADRHLIFREVARTPAEPVENSCAHGPDFCHRS